MTTTIALRAPTTWGAVHEAPQTPARRAPQRARTRVGLTDEEVRTSTYRGVLIGAAVIAGLWFFVRELR
jgi:ElaB/YqjD/DUF883 family membrane-anchored ribosome-binding protein